SDWPTDNTSATRAMSNRGAWLTTARRIGLYTYSVYSATPYICVTPGAGEVGGSRVKRSRNTPLFFERRGNTAAYLWRDVVPQPESASRSCLGSSFCLRALWHPGRSNLR